jgi:hypothetical protein
LDEPMLDFLIVGAGCFGATFARVVKDHGKSCLVIDKREHIAGNCFTTKQNGIDVHEYGAHIFHTSNEEVWNFVNRFSKFNNYRHTVKVSNFGKIYSFPINLMTLYQMWGVQTPESAHHALQQRQIPSVEDDLESYVLSQIGSGFGLDQSSFVDVPETEDDDKCIYIASTDVEEKVLDSLIDKNAFTYKVKKISVNEILREIKRDLK